MIHCKLCNSDAVHVPGCAEEPRTAQLIRLIANELIVLDQAQAQITFSHERIDAWRREYDAIQTSAHNTAKPT